MILYKLVKLSRLRLGLAIIDSLGGILRANLHFMGMLELGDDDPRGDHAEQGDAEVEADAHEVVGVAFGLHTR